MDRSKNMPLLPVGTLLCLREEPELWDHTTCLVSGQTDPSIGRSL